MSCSVELKVSSTTSHQEENMKVSIEQIENLSFSSFEDICEGGGSGLDTEPSFNDQVLLFLPVCLFLRLLLILSPSHSHVLLPVPQCWGSLAP